MANGEEIVQKVVIEVDDKQLSQIGETAEKSLDRLKESTDKAGESLNQLGEKADGAKDKLKEVGEGSGDSLDKVDEGAKDAASALEKLAESGGHSFDEIKKGAEYAGTSLEDFAKLSEHTQEQYIEYASRMTDETKKLGDAIKDAGQAGGGAGEGLGQVGKGLDEVSEKSGVSGRELRALGKIMSAFGFGEVSQLAIGLGRVATSLGALGVAALGLGLGLSYLYKTGEAMKAMAEEASKLSEVTANTPKQLENLFAAMEAGGAKAKSAGEATKQLVLELTELNKLKGLSEEAQKSLIDAANNVDKLKQSFKDAVQSTEGWARTVSAGAQATIDPLTDAAKGAEALKKAFLELPGAIKDGKPDMEAFYDYLNKLYNRMDEMGKLKLEEMMKKMKIPDDVIQSITKSTEEWEKLKKEAKETEWQRDAFKDFAQAVDKFKGQMGGLGRFIGAEFIIGLQYVGQFERAVVKFFSDLPANIRKGVSGLGEMIGNAFKGLGNLFDQYVVQPIKDGFNTAIEWIQEKAGTIVQTISEKWQAFKQLVNDYILQPIKDAWDGAIQWVEEKAGAFVQTIQQAWADLKQLADDYIVQPIKDAWNAAVEYAQEKAGAIIATVKEKWGQFKDWVYDTFYKPVKDAWDQAVAYIEGKVDSVIKMLERIKQAATDAWNAIKGMFGAGEGGGGGGGVPAAAGGYIVGPGTGTSDSIHARLSTGEFVMRAAAVERWGVPFMYALNSLTMPRFATGGLVPRMNVATPTPSISGQRTLTLNIEGRSFQGLQVPERVAQSLERFSVHSQIASTGRKQSWRR